MATKKTEIVRELLNDDALIEALGPLHVQLAAALHATLCEKLGLDPDLVVGMNLAAALEQEVVEKTWAALEQVVAHYGIDRLVTG